MNLLDDGRTVELEMNFAKELSYDIQVGYVDSVGIYFYFLRD